MKHDQPSQRHQLLLRGPAALFIKVLVLVALSSCAKGPFNFANSNAPIAERSVKDRQERLNEEARILDLDYQVYERALAKGDLTSAENALTRLLNRSPKNPKALEGMRRLEVMRSHEELITQAEALIKQKDIEGAKAKLRTVLAENPDDNRARKIMTQVDTSMSAGSLEALLSPSFRKPISIDFQDASLKQIFTVIGQTAGLNFIFDKDVKLDQKTTITLKNSTVEAAIYSMLTVNQLDQQIMDAKTVLVYPNNPAKIKEYQQTVVKSFMLTNARAKGVAESLKTILKSREVVVDEKLNMLIVRDSPEAIRLIEKIISLQDFPEPEVILELEVLEVSRDRMMDLGISPPGTNGLTLLPDGAVLADLARISKNNIRIGGASIKANATESDVDTLANPRIRVINREKAKILIGKKLPTYTVTTTPLAGTSTVFSTPVVTYVDVGLKLEVEPTIFLNGEVAIKVSLDVTNIVGTQSIPNTDTTVYTVGNRNASTTLRLKDGENQILAGLINNDSDRSVNKLPGLGDSPLLGRLFGSQKNIEKKTEILLSITPRLVRNLQRQEASINEFLGGTDSNLRLRPDFKVGALEEVIANPEINREAVPVPAQAVASPIEPAAQPPQPAPELPPVIQLMDTDSAAKPKEVQAKPDPKAKAEELKLKQAQAAEEKKQLQEQKRAAAAKAREEKAEELKLKQAQAAEEKKQLQEQKRAAAAKAREEKAEELKLKQAQAAEEKKQLQEQKRAAAAKAREEKAEELKLKQAQAAEEKKHGTDSNLRLRTDFKVGALEEVIANSEINREPVPVPAQAVASPIETAAQPPQPAPELPPVIQLTDTDSAAKPEAVQAKPDPKAKAEELKLKQAQAAEEKKQLQEQKRAAAAKARQEKAEELKLKQAQAAEEKKQLQEQKRAAAAKAREEKAEELKLKQAQAAEEKKQLQERLVRNLQRQEASINEFLGGTDSNLRLRTDFKVGALEEVIANSEINREPVPVPALAVASPIEPAAQPPQPAPELPPVIQLTDTDSAAKPEAVQAKPDPKAKAEELKLKQAQAAEEKKQLQEQKRAAAAKAREEKAEELKLKQAQAAEEKKQLQEQKRAAAAKAREEKLLEKKKPVDKNKASPETRQFIDNIMKQNEAP